MFKNLFMSAGAMKAGTTWVYDKMKHHPQVSFCMEKEIHYFSHQAKVANTLELKKRIQKSRRAINKMSRSLQQGDMSHIEFREGVSWYTEYMVDEISDDWYLNLFEKEKRENSDIFCADFSNLSCFLQRDGWNHVRSLAKNLKVIYILRDPIGRLWSHYKFHLEASNNAQKNEPEKNFELFKRIISKPWFIRNSMYCENLERLRGSLAESEFKTFYLDDFSSRPAETFDQVHQFLGISEFAYPGMDMKERKNSSLERELPDGWMELVKEVLDEEIVNLKSQGLLHDNWTTF